MTEEGLKQHLYELSYALDSQSAGKDYIALRRTHYDNIKWLQEHGLTDEYYKVFFEHIKAESEVQDADDADTETWNGYHGQVTAPKGTFKRIYADADGGDTQEATDD